MREQSKKANDKQSDTNCCDCPPKGLDLSYLFTACRSWCRPKADPAPEGDSDCCPPTAPRDKDTGCC